MDSYHLLSGSLLTNYYSLSIVIIRRQKELPSIAKPKPDQLFYLKEIHTSEITDEESREIHKRIDDAILKYEKGKK